IASLSSLDLKTTDLHINAKLKGLYKQGVEKFKLRDFKGARENLYEILNLLTQNNYNSTTTQQANCLRNISVTYSEEGNVPEALKCLEAALQLKDSQGNYGLSGKYRVDALRKIASENIR